jgi:acylphosphatase
MRRITHLVIRGQVQGVSFRAWTQAEAEQRGLDGWVRNREDGAVEAVLAGEAEAIVEIAAACRIGPQLAIVTDVIELEFDEEPPPGFRIRH